MKLLQNILVPTDFSDSSERAIEASIQMAKSFQSKIILLHVFSEEDLSADNNELLEKAVEEQLKEQKDKIEKNGIQVADVILEKGIAVEEIIQVAQDRNVNVMVVGSGNKTSNDHFKLGITVEKLMQKNQIPIWVVKNEEVKPIKKIICPVDFSGPSIRAFKNAITLAEKFKAELSLIHVFEPVNTTSVRISLNTEEENRKRKQNKEKELKQFLSKYELDNIKLNVHLLLGDAFLEIFKAIKRDESDLLIMGTTGKTGLSKMFMGSVTEKVTRELPCSFITTKAIDITDNYLESNLKGIEFILKCSKNLLEEKEYERAIDNFIIGIKQYPDNIPMLKGIVEAYEKMGNQKKAEYYRAYIKQVIERLWGKEYIDKLSN